MAKRSISLLLAFCLFASFFGTLPRANAAEASLGIGTVDIGQPGKTTAIYDKPNGKAIHWLTDGTEVSILDIVKDDNGNLWYYVRYTPDVFGYIQGTKLSNVTLNPPSSPGTNSSKAKVGTVNKKVKSCLKVRSKPSNKGYKTLERLYPGDHVTLIGTEKSEGILWDIVLTEKGEQGWCTSGYIDTNAPSSSPSNSERPKDDMYEMGTIVGPTPIYTYDSKKGLIRTSVSFVGGERVNLNVTELVTNTNGDQFYHFEFGELVEYVPALSAVRDSDRDFHGRPDFIETYTGEVNYRVKTCLLVRSTPSDTSYTVLDRLYCGDDVNIMDHTHIGGIKWYRLFRGNDPDGWVKAIYIDLPSERVIHESVTGIGRISQRTTAYIYPGKQSAEDKTFLGGEKVHIFELITIGKVKQYACEFGGDTYYVDTSDVNFSVPRNAFLHTIN